MNTESTLNELASFMGRLQAQETEADWMAFEDAAEAIDWQHQAERRELTLQECFEEVFAECKARRARRGTAAGRARRDGEPGSKVGLKVGSSTFDGIRRDQQRFVSSPAPQRRETHQEEATERRDHASGMDSQTRHGSEHVERSAERSELEEGELQEMNRRSSGTILGGRPRKTPDQQSTHSVDTSDWTEETGEGLLRQRDRGQEFPQRSASGTNLSVRQGHGQEVPYNGLAMGEEAWRQGTHASGEGQEFPRDGSALRSGLPEWQPPRRGQELPQGLASGHERSWTAGQGQEVPRDGLALGLSGTPQESLLRRQLDQEETRNARDLFATLPVYKEGGATDVFVFTELVRGYRSLVNVSDMAVINLVLTRLGDAEKGKTLRERNPGWSLDEFLRYMEDSFDVERQATLRREVLDCSWTSGALLDCFERLAKRHERAVARGATLLPSLEVLTRNLLTEGEWRRVTTSFPQAGTASARQMAKWADAVLQPKDRTDRSRQKTKRERRPPTTGRRPPKPERHEPGERRCFICNKPGHLKAQCPKRKATARMAATGGQGQLRDEVRVEGQPVEAVLDTGAEVSLMTLSAAERLLPPGAIRPFSGIIRAIGGIGSREVNQIAPEVKVELEGEERTIPIWVVDDQGQPWDGAELYIGFDVLSHEEGEAPPEQTSCSRTEETPQEWMAVTLGEGEPLTEARLKGEPPRLGVRPGATPFAAPTRKVPDRLREPLRETLIQLVRDGVIEEAPSVWGTGPVLVAKKDGSIRFTVDFRRLNEECIPQVRHPRLISCITQDMAAWSIFTKMDLKSGYYQIPLHELDRQYTGFRTVFGSYVFKRLPQGTRNAPAIFQRLMEEVIDGLPERQVAVYLDDLVIGAASQEELEGLEQEVIRRLTEYNLKINPKKSARNVPEVEILGWRVANNQVRPPAERISRIEDWPTPRSATELRSFLGAIEFFRRGVPGLAGRAAPLYDKLKKTGTPWPLTPEEEEAVSRLKTAVAASQVNARGGEGYQLSPVTDASTVGMGAALLHVNEATEDTRVLGFWSHHLSKAEQNYSATKLELMGVVLALEHFADQVIGEEVMVYTDHKPLLGLLWKREPPAVIWRWIQRLAIFQIQLRYLKGSENVVADYLSRLPQEACLAPFTTMDWAKEQDKDPKVASLKKFLTSGEWPSSREEQTTVRMRPSGLEMEGATLRVKGKIYVPERLVPLVVEEGLEGATSIKEVKEKVLQTFYFANSATVLPKVVRERRPDISQRPAAYKPKHQALQEEAPPSTAEEKVEEEPRLEDIPEEPGWEVDDLRIELYGRMQKEDSLCRRWREMASENGSWPKGISEEEGLLRKDGKLYLPDRATREEMDRIHLQGHVGTRKMVGIFKAKLAGPTPWKHAEDARQACDICRRMSREVRGAVGVSTPTLGPSQVVHVDFFGPVATTRNGNKYAMVIVDTFSGFTEAYPLAHQDASAALYGLTQWITHFGAPRILVSDQGSAFVGQAFRQLLQAHKAEHRFSSAFHPQANGQVEVRNRILKAILKRLTNGGVEDWDLQLPWALAALNSSPHSRHGYAPHFVMMGYHFNWPNTPVWPGSETIDGHVASVLRVKENVNEIVLGAIEEGRRAAQREPTVSFEPGEWVWAKDPSQRESKSFGDDYSGPFLVHRKISPHLYEIFRRGKGVIYNVNHLKRSVKDLEQALPAMKKKKEKRKTNGKGPERKLRKRRRKFYAEHK